MSTNRNEYYVRPVNGNDSTGDGLSHATAWKTTAHALDTITKDATDGDRINICDEGTDTLTATLPLADYMGPQPGFSTAMAGVIFEGYTSTAGDGGIFSIDGNGYSITGVMNYHDFISFINGKFTNWGQSNWCLQIDDYCNLINVEFDGTRSGTNCTKAVSFGSYCKIYGCKFHNMSSYSAATCSASTGAHWVFNYFDIPAQPSVRVYNSCMVYGNIIINSRTGTSECIDLRNGRNSTIQNNTLIYYGSTGTGQAIGLYHSNEAYSTNITIQNNYIEGYNGVGAYGINFTGGDQNYVSSNYYYNCTNTETFPANTLKYDRVGPTVLSDPGLVNEASGDFRPRKVLVGKAEYYANAAFLTAGTKQAVDIGAIQRVRGVGSRATSLQAGRVR